MIDATHPLPMIRQAELLAISHSNLYYLPRPTSSADLAMMRQIDELHLNYPFAGSRMLRDMLRLKDVKVGRQHVATLMAKMGITAISRQRKTSVPHPAHPIYPYLLKGLTIDRPNHCWAADITYIPMRRGFVYLVAIVDWATRKVLAHRVSISMSPDFCVEALEEAIARYGRPEIFNTDQGSQFTSADFVERIWKSVKYEHVYLHAYENVAEARQQLASYFILYNTERPHSSLGGRTPDMTYFNQPFQQAA